MDQIQHEWVENEWIVIADHDAIRFTSLLTTLSKVGFPRERILHAKDATMALEILAAKKASILFLDESFGTTAFREIHAYLNLTFGEMGFFFFAITEGQVPNFVQFAAQARIDGVIFRPYHGEEFCRRVAEVFSVKWPNRLVESVEERSEYLVRGKTEQELFERAIEKEQRLGYRDPLTPDAKISSIFGLRPVSHPGVTPGKPSFSKVRLSFKAVAKNGDPLKKPFPIHALEIDEERATFECATDTLEMSDNITIEAEISHGEENYFMRIEAKVISEPSEGYVSVAFDKGNWSRFEAAMKMVARRFKELKDFFKYAKGA